MQININKDRYVINEFVEDKEIYSTKIVDALPSDINQYFYKYINGELVRDSIIQDNTFDGIKAAKQNELVDYIYNMKEYGVEYQGKMFKCDDLASSRINKIVTGILAGASPFPLTWITRNSSDGVIVFNTKEEFMDFYNIFSIKELDIQVKEATYKMQIELATNEEDLNAIVFESYLPEEPVVTEETNTDPEEVVE